MVETVENRILYRVHFKKREHAKYVEWEWFWTKVSPNNVDVIGDGGEGYGELRSALNGFFAGEGMPDWKPMSITPGQVVMPDGYTIQKFSDDHYVIIRFKIEDTEENSGDSTDD